MYCTNCGREVSSAETFCPYCGIQLTVDNVPDDLNVSKYGITGRSILKILSAIIMICFFCPSFLVSCSGTEVVTFSMAELAVDREYMGEQIEGNFMFALFLILPLISLVYLFIKSRRKSHGRVCAVVSMICSVSALVIYFMAKGNLEEDAGYALELQMMLAFYIYILCGFINIFLGTYLDFLSRKKENSFNRIAISDKDIWRKSISVILLSSFIGVCIIALLY